jgi:hypothetical protein
MVVKGGAAQFVAGFGAKAKDSLLDMALADRYYKSR